MGTFACDGLGDSDESFRHVVEQLPVRSSDL